MEAPIEEPAATKHYVDACGAYIGGYCGAEPPEGAIEVPVTPLDARETWDEAAGAWVGVDPVAEILAEIEGRYAPKFAILQSRLLTILLADGPDEAAKTAALRVEWAALADKKDVETLQALEGM